MRKILALIMLVAITTILSACNSSREYIAKIDSGDVAKLTIYTFDGKNESNFGLMNLGHAFLSIENLTDDNIKVHSRELTGRESITIGTWSIRDHFGVWYNVESNYISEYNKYDGRVSVTIGISEDDLIVISEYIAKSDNWNPLNNCTVFAIGLWNKVASESEKIDVSGALYTPSELRSEIEKFDTFEINRPIETDKEFGYFVGDEFVSHTWFDEVAV